jgi:hypothetical protein
VVLPAARQRSAGRLFYEGGSMKRTLFKGLMAIAAATALQAVAEPALFRGADLKLGQQLMAEHQCSACHTRKVGGDGSAIYKPQGRINTPAFLRGMVEQCNTELNLGMFPEDVTAVAAVLNRDHYKFK